MCTLNLEWKAIDWKSVQSKVFVWQQEIYTASKGGDIRTVRKVQRVLLNSIEAKLLATRRVTQDNKGKKTPGVDGISELSPKERIELAGKLCFPTRPKPLRRVWLPKPGKTEKRPLGIPTIQDRALQGLLKLAMEPEWEARFEANSYGFRPGRSPHDAIAAIKGCISKRSKYVLDADIAKCFDSIDHDKLLDKVGFKKGAYRTQLRYWLKAGVLDANVFQPTETGTPQGGVISPLLANIALHGLENHLKDHVAGMKLYFGTSNKKMGTKDARSSVHVIRYADDFVVLHYSREVLLACREETKKFLAEIGLELSAAKTRLTHTLELKADDTSELGFDGIVGFNFLGFTIKQWKSIHRSMYHKKTKLGFKTLVIPSKDSQKKHQRKLKQVILKDGLGLDQTKLIEILNPIIRGWASYFGVSDANSAGILSKQGYLLYLKLRKWSKRKKGSIKGGTSYWFKTPNSNWSFGIKNQIKLVSYGDHSLPLNSTDGYVKIRGEASPFDGNESYWTARFNRIPGHTTVTKILLRKQKGKCKWCGLPFTDDDVIERDHIIPRREPFNGSNEISNLQLLHRHCHDIKTANEVYG
jgi:RNA-directed DNA polymerase